MDGYLFEEKGGGEWISYHSKIKIGKISIFQISLTLKGNQNNMASLTTGTLPLVSAKKTDNGYKGFVSKEQRKSFEVIF